MSDLQAAINTLHRFFHLVDSYTLNPVSCADAFADLFTADAVFLYRQRGLSKTGRSEMAELCASMGTRFAGFSHFEANIAMELVGANRASSVSYWSAVDRGAIVAVGRHFDELERGEDAKWRFSKRRVTFTWTREDGNASEGFVTSD